MGTADHVRSLDDFLYVDILTVGPRLIGPIGTEDFSPLSQGYL